MELKVLTIMATFMLIPISLAIEGPTAPRLSSLLLAGSLF